MKMLKRGRERVDSISGKCLNEIVIESRNYVIFSLRVFGCEINELFLNSEQNFYIQKELLCWEEKL